MSAIVEEHAALGPVPRNQKTTYGLGSQGSSEIFRCLLWACLTFVDAIGCPASHGWPKHPPVFAFRRGSAVGNGFDRAAHW